MSEFELIDCEFINEYLRFVTYKDFCRNCQAIKGFYNSLNKNSKRFYKWYVYANPFIDEGRKNIIWQFLNNDEPEYLERLIHTK